MPPLTARRAVASMLWYATQGWPFPIHCLVACFGMHASLWDEIGALGVTHIVFILVPGGFLTAPVAIMKDYIMEAGISPKSDGSVRHYHVLISPEPKLELFHHGKAIRIPLKEYYEKFD
jgi:hypothetical protein